MTTQDVSGLLYSQIGYDLGEPKRAIVRGHSKKFLPGNTVMSLTASHRTETIFEAKFKYWGERWASHWWVADFTEFDHPGIYDIHVSSKGKELFSGENLHVGKKMLWNSTWRLAAIDQFERRAVLAKAKMGWQDAGTMWQESNTHSSTVISLCELITFQSGDMEKDDISRIAHQIANGCAYLAASQDKACKLGFGDGPVSHDIIGHENEILPADTSKAVIAWVKAAGNPHLDRTLRQDCLARAKTAMAWLMTKAKPTSKNFAWLTRGASPDYKVPDEWSTNDLLLFCWGAFELASSGLDYQDTCANFAKRVASRQVAKSEQMDGLWGHFFTFDDRSITEKAWTHNLEGNVFGCEAGATYPFFVLPLVEMCRKWPEHPDAGLWQETLANFAYGFFLPACRRNPFFLLPLGIYEKEGLIWFASLWHGMNTVYGLAAALAIEFEQFFKDRDFHEIAVGNLQWIAGLNSGITQESQSAAVITSMDIPPRIALPVSFMCGVGNRWAGTWLNTRGVICNGFSTGQQFKFDVEPKKANDGPFTFTDEEWITHNTGWISGLSRFMACRKQGTS